MYTSKYIHSMFVYSEPRMAETMKTYSYPSVAERLTFHVSVFVFCKLEEEDEQDDNFDVNISVTNPEKIGEVM